MIRILEDLEGSRSRVMSILIQITYIYGYNTFSSKTGMEVDEKEGESGTSVSDDERPGTSIPDDEMSETEESENHIYEVLGHDTFVNLKKIDVVPAWIRQGETFASELGEESCAELDSVEGLHPLLAHRIREHLKKWYPVQRTVLPYLVAASSICSIFPPRDLVISSPTGSGKTLCYVIPILNALRGCTMMGYLFALIVAPVQNLVDQIEKTASRKRKYSDSNAGSFNEHITDLDFPVDFTHLRYLVVDEADRMSHTARIEWLNDLEVVANYSHNCVTIDDLYNASFLQKILLSATLSLDVEDLHEWRLRHPRLFKAVKEDVIVTNELSLSSVIIPTSLKIEYIICDTKFKPLATYERIEGRKILEKDFNIR
ncbi:hypothetical protein LOAG_17815 [Loa loa]|uniref:ATP-dependent RNA helicase n=1 Tax=Loa loa TaxID=7209 RepID=A0A1S0UJ86_LOALO|nr:hypothetical protein LOAG_17815 [Loa loa]EJD74937.1 hypothetical protein LOAG_17815 [Loa loa]